VLLVTVVHEWAYFKIVGLNFRGFSSAYDYFSNAILWLALNVGPAAVLLVPPEFPRWLRNWSGWARVGAQLPSEFVQWLCNWSGLVYGIAGFIFAIGRMLSSMR
jgi:hypothetical protein